MIGDVQTARIESLRRSLTHQQNIFSRTSTDFKTACEVNYEIVLIIAKSGRPFTDGDFVKQCMITASEKLCPEAAGGGFESYDSSTKNFTSLFRSDKTACE